MHYKTLTLTLNNSLYICDVVLTYLSYILTSLTNDLFNLYFFLSVLSVQQRRLHIYRIINCCSLAMLLSRTISPGTIEKVQFLESVNGNINFLNIVVHDMSEYQ